MAMMQKPPRTADDLPAADIFPAYDVREIMMQGEQARLILDGVVYTLRITRAGKLILTK